MKTKFIKLSILIPSLLLWSFPQAKAQNVGVNTMSPENNLDVEGTFRSRGAVTFKSQTIAAANTISVTLTGETSLLVNNVAGNQANVVTFSAGTPQEGQLFLITNLDDNPVNVDGKFVGAGKGCIFIYQNTEWRPLSEPPSSSNDWTLTGNGTTVPGTGAGQNFLGTTDLKDLVIATNNSDRIHITASGRVGINQTAPQTRFHVESAETGHIAVFDNNTVNGDGIKIRLQGLHPLWNGTNYDTMAVVTDQFDQDMVPVLNAVRFLITTGGNLDVTDPVAVANGLNLQALANQAICHQVNSVLGQINSSPINLPLPTININLPNYVLSMPDLSVNPPSYNWNPPPFNWTPPAFVLNLPALTLDMPSLTINPPSYNITIPGISVNPPALTASIDIDPINLNFGQFSWDPLGTGTPITVQFPTLNVDPPNISASINLPSFNIPGQTFSFNPPSFNWDPPAFIWNPPGVNYQMPTLSFDIPSLPINLPSFNVPIPDFNLNLPNFPLNIPDIPLPAFPLGNCSPAPQTFDFLNIGTAAPNSLGSSYEYITFVDQDDRWCGAIKAMNPDDYLEGRLSTCALYSTISSFASLDPLDLAISAKVEQVCHIEDYNNMGVSYESGHGDYAEWLERTNPTEEINFGEIVGIKGGKISKDLTDAEQVMVISKAPIVLGNSPKPEQLPLGNMVAFIGQVPVKIMGPVKSGDYIVADLNNNGWGKAVSPDKITAEEFKYAVGRSWDTNPSEGFKFVNTLVGMHNNAWVNPMKKMQQQLNNLESSQNSLEARLEAIENTLNTSARNK